MSRFLFNLLYGIIRFLPYRLYHALAWLGAWGIYGVSVRLRRNAVDSLTIAFGATISRRQKEAIARASFLSLILGLADFVFYVVRPGRAADVFSLEGGEYLQEAHRKGLGTVVAIAHLGPFAAMLFKFLYEGYKVWVVMRPPRSKALRQDLVTRREAFAPQPIYSTPVRECVVACSGVLQRNEVLVMPVDQNYGGSGRVFVDFFGRKAATAAGPAAYAVKTGAALLTAFARPGGRGRWKITVAPVAVDRTVPERDAVLNATQQITARVEAEARARPGEWSCMHRGWKAVPREGEI